MKFDYEMLQSNGIKKRDVTLKCDNAVSQWIVMMK